MADLQSMTLQERMITIINAEHSLSYGINDLTLQEACNKWLIETGTVNGVDYSGISINKYSPEEAFAIIRHKLDLRSENLTELVHELGPYYPIHKYTAQEALNKKNAVLAPYSLSFDGSGDYVNLGDSSTFSFAPTEPFSISAWAKFDVAATRTIITKGANATSDYEWRFFTNANGYLHLACYHNTVGPYIGRSYDVALSTGQWYHLVGTYAGGTVSSGIEVYVNGVAVSTTTYESGSFTGMTDNSGDVIIGKYSNDFDGKIDEVSIFNKELTQAEINSLYAANPQNAGDAVGITNLVGYWKMDHGSGLVARDVSEPEELSANMVEADASANISGTYGWTAYGTNTITNDNGSLMIDYGNDQYGASFYFKAAEDGFTSNLVIGKTYKVTFDTKIAANSARWIVYNGTNYTYGRYITNTEFEREEIYIIARNTTTCRIQTVNFSAGDEYIWIDNLSVKEVTNGNHGTITGATWTVH